MFNSCPLTFRQRIRLLNLPWSQLSLNADLPVGFPYRFISSSFILFFVFVAICVTRFLCHLSSSIFLKVGQMVNWDLWKSCIHLWLQRSKVNVTRTQNRKQEVTISLSLYMMSNFNVEKYSSFPNKSNVTVILKNATPPVENRVAHILSYIKSTSFIFLNIFFCLIQQLTCLHQLRRIISTL